MDLVVPLERVTVAIEGAVARFPVRRIYCVSRNYLDHIRETAGAEGREPALFFQKPTDALLPGGEDFPYPPPPEPWAKAKKKWAHLLK